MPELDIKFVWNLLIHALICRSYFLTAEYGGKNVSPAHNCTMTLEIDEANTEVNLNERVFYSIL